MTELDRPPSLWLRLKAFVRQEHRDKTWDVWIVLAFSTCLIAFVLGVVEFQLDMVKIFPAPEDRYDVTEVHMALMKDLCPEEAKAPSIAAFEKCQEKLSLSDGAFAGKFAKVRIPTLEEAAKGTPNLYEMLRRIPEHERLVEAMAAGEFYVFGVEVPAQYVTVDGDYREAGSNTTFKGDALNPYVLTYAGQRFAQICVDGRCSYAMREGLTGLRTVYLTARAAPSKAMTVWGFAAENANALGILTTHGFMITRSSQLLRANLFYWFVATMQGIRSASWFAALFFMGIYFAANLRGFRDYTFFVLLAASAAVWIMVLQIGVVVPYFRGKPQHLLRIWAHANLCIAILQYFSAITRTREGKYLSDFLVAQGVLGAAIVTIGSLLDGQTLIQHADIVPLIFAVVAVAGPFTIVGMHLGWLERAIKETNPRTRRGLLVVLKRRRREDLIHLGLWSIFAGSLIYQAQRGLGNQSMYHSYISAAVFLLSFGVLLYFTFASTRTRTPRRPAAELEYLKEVVSAEEFSKLIASPISGILKTQDLANSSLIPASEAARKQGLLARLVDHWRARQEPEDLVWNLLNFIGDERQEVFCQKHENLADDFREVVDLTARFMLTDIETVKAEFPECGLHVAVFVLRDMLVTDGGILRRGGRNQHRQADLLDFASSEANLFLKYLNKSWRPGCFIVGAPAAFFTSELRENLLDREVFPLGDHLRGLGAQGQKVKPELIDQADQLGLCFGFGMARPATAASPPVAA